MGEPTTKTLARDGRFESCAWAAVFALIGAIPIVARWGFGREATDWMARNHSVSSSHLPIVAAVVVGGTASLRIGRLVRERGEAWPFAITAGLQTLAGAAMSAFALVCAAQGTLGSRGPGFSRAMDVLLFALLVGGVLVAVQLAVLLTRLFARSRTWAVHVLGPLAWLAGAANLTHLGLAFMLD